MYALKKNTSAISNVLSNKKFHVIFRCQGNLQSYALIALETYQNWMMGTSTLKIREQALFTGLWSKHHIAIPNSIMESREFSQQLWSDRRLFFLCRLVVAWKMSTENKIFCLHSTRFFVYIQQKSRTIISLLFSLIKIRIRIPQRQEFEACVFQYF